MEYKKEMTKEEKKRMKERRKKKNKIEIFAFDFLDCEKKSWNFGAIFDIRISLGLLSIRVVHLFTVYLGAAPIP